VDPRDPRQRLADDQGGLLVVELGLVAVAERLAHVTVTAALEQLAALAELAEGLGPLELGTVGF
jgi:hypothetical protein